MGFRDNWKQMREPRQGGTHNTRDKIEAVPSHKVDRNDAEGTIDASKILTSDLVFSSGNSIYDNLKDHTILMDRAPVDLSHVTEEALNEQVQSLTQQGKFQTAADIIADWAFWDMIGRYSEPPEVDYSDNQDGDYLLDIPVLPPDEDQAPPEEEEDRSSSMLDLMQVRLDEEFGEHGWRP